MAVFREYLRNRKVFVEFISEALKPEYHVDDIKGHINIYQNEGKYQHLGTIEYNKSVIGFCSSWIFKPRSTHFDLCDPSFSWDDLKSVIEESAEAYRNKHHPSTPDWVFEIDYSDCDDNI